MTTATRVCAVGGAVALALAFAAPHAEQAGRGTAPVARQAPRLLAGVTMPRAEGRALSAVLAR